MTAKVIVVTDEMREYPIQPKDINPDIRPHGILGGQSETPSDQFMAQVIVKLCQGKGGWFPFSFNDLREYFQAEEDTLLFDLSQFVEPGSVWKVGASLEGVEGLIIWGSDDLYYITHTFIVRCFAAAPVLRIEQPCEA